jgi:phage baseplate assembly protein W
MDIRFPYGFATNGWTAQSDLPTHIRDMVEQILLTSPGERVNRPTFGTGTGALVFEPNSGILAAAQQQLIQASLQQWLSDLIRVESVEVTAEDSTLLITVRYTILVNQQQQTQQFVYGGEGAA